MIKEAVANEEGKENEAGVGSAESITTATKKKKKKKPSSTSRKNGNLEAWAKQGVLLLNATLTVEHKKANSHADIGWSRFTDAAIRAVAQHRKGVVFLLWGAFAQKKGKFVDAVGSMPYMLSCADHSFFFFWGFSFGAISWCSVRFQIESP